MQCHSPGGNQRRATFDQIKVMNIILRLLATAFVAYGLSTMLSGVHIADFKTAIVFALVLAVLNVLIKPVLIILTLPITIVTFGLFLLVINTLIIIITDKLMDSIRIDGFWWALLFAICLSALTSILVSLFTTRNNRAGESY